MAPATASAERGFNVRFRVGAQGATLLRDASVPACSRLDHPAYQAATELGAETRQALVADLTTR